jgi:hypothetical protein
MRCPTAVSALLAALALGAFGPPAVAAAEPPSTDVAACYDGSCTLRLTGPVEIPLDGRAGHTGLSVSEVGPHSVAFQVRSGTGRSLSVVGRGGTVRFGSQRGTVTVHVLELGPDTAVIELSTQLA